MDTKIRTIKQLAPEDIKVGDYVAITHETCDVLRGFFSECSQLTVESVTFIDDAAGQPFKVCNICLPFVLVRMPNGQHRTIDVRQARLAKLKKSYGKAAMKALKPPKEQS